MDFGSAAKGFRRHCAGVVREREKIAKAICGWSILGGFVELERERRGTRMRKTEESDFI